MSTKIKKTSNLVHLFSISHQKKNNRMPAPLVNWQKLFWGSLGLSLGAAFCMKWMEPDFVQNGELFTIIGLEISYSREELMALLGGLEPPIKTILRYHLFFDFAFMAGIYPCIASLCMLVRNRFRGSGHRRVLFIAALLQTAAWVCDIYENCCLLQWINDPVTGNAFGFYHVAVYIKWSLALGGIFVAAGYWLLAIGRKLKAGSPSQNS
jgi:hypothetical protein